METAEPTNENQITAKQVAASAEETTTAKLQDTNTAITTAAALVKDDEKKKEIVEPKEMPTATLEKPVVAAVKSLSDGEKSPTPPPLPLKVAKKRRTLGGAREADGEERIRLKRRKIKVAGAPKMPLTGYVRYMNDRREMLKKEYPAKTAIEHTKIIGEEWSQLSEERKAPYMKAAEIDKQRYLAELHIFLKARPDVLASELAKNKKPAKTDDKTGGHAPAVLKEKAQMNGGSGGNTSLPKAAKDSTITVGVKEKRNVDKDNTPPPAPKRKRTPTPITNSQHTNAASQVGAPPTTTAPPTLAAPVVPGEIPIFTNDFLENNKSFDLELRMLRKTKTDLEQQNAVLEKHVENMKFGVEKMVNENDELQEKNRLLEIYLEKLKRKLANALSELAIPSEPQGATLDNIDKYMDDLYKMATTNTHGPASLNKAKDIIRKLDLQIQL